MTCSRKIINCLLFLLFLLSSNYCLAAITNITGFRVATTAQKSRLVFDLTNKPDYVFFTLSNPNRIVLDIKNTNFTTHIDKQALKKTPVASIRLRFYKDYIRIVMDLKHPVLTHNFIFSTNKGHDYRLVMDMRRAEHMTTAAAALPSLPLPVTKQINAQPSPATTSQDDTNPAPVMTLANKASVGRDIIVVIDPGHGGKDPGTTGRGGMREKDVVLAISKNLQRALNKEPGFHAVLTRNADYYISLRGRLNIARRDKADMFVAIHADAYQNSNAMGASIFALSERGATSEAARWLAEKENKSELLGGASLPDNDNVLRSVLIDLSQTNTISESLQIGTSVLRQLGNVTTLHHARVEQAAFVVLKSPDIPSLLVETGFLSTPRQEQQLRNPRYQQLLANAIMQGIKSYFVRNPPQGTLLAAQRFNGVSNVASDE